MFPCPWEVAEECVEEVVGEIVQEGGERIHYHRLAEKSTPFAAQAASKTILSQLGIAFVRHESLENDDFHLEKIPNIQPNPADYWGRMLRPIMPMDEHERRVKAQEDAAAAMASPSGGGGKTSPGGRSKKGGAASSDAGKTDSRMDDLANRKTKLQEDIQEDEEENKYRQVKEREEKTKQEAIAKAESDKKAGEEQKRRADKLLEQMAQQTWTFDTAGKLMWVDPADGNKLPKVISEITSKGEAVGKKTSKKQGDSPSPEKSPKSRSRSPGAKKKPKGPQFTDGFTRLQSEQPPITETMNVKSGVTLMSKGQVKKGGPSDDTRMSRTKYQQFLEAEQSGQATSATFYTATQKTEPAAAPELPPLDVSQASPGPKSGAGSAAGSARGSAAGSLDQDRPGGSMFGPLSAPSTTKDWRLKRDAIGNLGRFPRHHVGLLGTTASAGFARCLPQPMLGATMGHGLKKNESFFFPDTLTTNEFERSMSRASTTGKSFYRNASTTEATTFSDLMERDRREVVTSIRRMDIRSNLRSGGGRMQTREKGRAILDKAMMGRTQ